MAVPVIGVSSITKSTMSIYRQDGGSTTSAVYVDMGSDLTMPSVVDGDKIFLFFQGQHSIAHNTGAVRLIGATSGTVIHERETPATPTQYGMNDFGVWKLTKTTGVTEDIKVQWKANGGGTFHGEANYFTGKGMANVDRVLLGDQKVSVKTTVHIDEIDLVCIGSKNSNHSNQGCPTIGFSSTTVDTKVQTFYPNQMYNELLFTNSINESSTNKLQFILYSITGKKLTMS